MDLSVMSFPGNVKAPMGILSHNKVINVHFYRLHNEIGFPEGFQAWLIVLYEGFFRNPTKGKTGTAAPHLNEDANNVGVDDEQNVCQEGK
jgi:hypothetical protein